MFESPKDRFSRLAWWLPLTMSVALPLALDAAAAVAWPLVGALFALTAACWSLRRFEASLIGCLTLLPLATSGLLLLLSPSPVSAVVGALLITPPLTVLTALRPRLGLGLALASFAMIALGHAPGQLGVVLFSFASTATLGLIMAAFFQEVGLSHGGLSEAALTDPITGTGNFYALKRDFRRYEAQVDRDGSSLLIVRWYFGTGGATNGVRCGLSTAEIASALALNVRQGDALYYLGDDEFVSLHQNLTTGAHMRERFLPVVKSADISWARCEGLTLVQLLEEVRDAGRARVSVATLAGVIPPS